MPQEQRYTALVLKKTAYAEADEIITVFTKQNGKLRVLAKSIKRPMSKLQQMLQPLFLLECAVVGRENLPKIIQAQPVQIFSVIAENPDRVAVWFVIAEMLQKSLPDDQTNEPLFDATVEYLRFLNRPTLTHDILQASLTAFKISFLRHIGLAIHYPKSDGLSSVPAWFSLSNGGFHGGAQMTDSQSVSPEIWYKFVELCDWDFNTSITLTPSALSLSDMVSSFVTYQLEREIKADRFLS